MVPVSFQRTAPAGYTGRGPMVTLLLLLLFFLPGIATASLNIRLPVTVSGLYRLSYQDLGISQAIASDNLHLSNRGQDVALLIDDGGDGQFGPGDSLRFYARALGHDDPEFPYTNASIYWLRDSYAPAVTMGQWNSGTPGVSEIGFAATVHAEQNWAYWWQLPNGDGRDHWFWGQTIAAGGSRALPITVTDPVGSDPITLRIALQGFTNVAASPDHHTRVKLNSCTLGDVNWDGQTSVSHSFSAISATCLQDGNNTVTVFELNDLGVLVDSIYVDWIDVDYQRALVARNDVLDIPITTGTNKMLTITGFSSAAVTVLDIGDPDRPIIVGNLQTTTNNGIDYSVSFVTRASGAQHFLAIADTALRQPIIETPGYSGPALSTTTNGADYLLITSAELRASVNRLAQYRAGQGYRVKVVTTEQIYDEYGDGYATPMAIKAFISDAYAHWQSPAPRFLTLVGDATQDYKDYYQTGQINHVPTYLIEVPGLGQVPSDHWYVTVAGNDDLPDLMLGRIPAKTADEVSIFTDKLIAYETGLPGSWPSRILMASGDQDNRFRDYSDGWMAHVPAAFTRFFINPLDYAFDKYLARADFSTALNTDGVGIVTYFGHGSVDRWLASNNDGTLNPAPLQLIASDDMKSLSNTRAIPVFFAFNCLNGMFSLPNEGKTIKLPDNTTIKYDVPLPEALLFAEGKGAVAMWSPSSFAYPSEQRWIGEALFTQIFDKGDRTLGSAVTTAKVQPYLDGLIDKSNLDVFTLIGDPATQLRVTGGQSVNVAQDSSAGGGGTVSCDVLIALILVWSLMRFRGQLLRRRIS